MTDLGTIRLGSTFNSVDNLNLTLSLAEWSIPHETRYSLVRRRTHRWYRAAQGVWNYLN